MFWILPLHPFIWLVKNNYLGFKHIIFKLEPSDLLSNKTGNAFFETNNPMHLFSLYLTSTFLKQTNDLKANIKSQYLPTVLLPRHLASPFALAFLNYSYSFQNMVLLCFLQFLCSIPFMCSFDSTNLASA